MKLKTIQSIWKDQKTVHEFINEMFKDEVNNTPELKEMRDWVEENKWGFGERSFYWMWKLIVDEMPDDFYFLEIGVFRGQILALIKLLADKAGKKVTRFGITPLDSTEGYWESDYESDIQKIHDQFKLHNDYYLIKGLSTDQKVIEAVASTRFDLMYIDGGHDYNTVKSDVINYTPLLLPGGFLVMDDSACKFKMPFGYFQGHQEVSKAVDELLPKGKSRKYEHILNVVHNRVWRKR